MNAFDGYRRNSLAQLSDQELAFRLRMIGKLAIGLLTLHLGMPMFGILWLMRSAVKIDMDVTSTYEDKIEEMVFTNTKRAPD